MQRSRRRAWIGLGAAGVVIVAVIVAIAAGAHHTTATNAASGGRAPDGAFTSTSGATRTISSLRGQPTLLWFVTTWCSSCQAGTPVMARNIATLTAHHVRVVELENAGDLGQPGPSISSFAQRFAGAAYSNPDWTWGVASGALMQAYNPSGFLDVYYLLTASGRIVDVNSSPAGTMSDLLAHVNQL